MQFNDNNDYLAILGSMRGVAPPRQMARGLVKLNDVVYEYQGAHCSSYGDDEFSYLSEIVLSFKSMHQQQAQLIPSLPDTLSCAELFTRFQDSSSIPSGIFEDDLMTAQFVLSENTIGRILYAKPLHARKFLSELIPFLLQERTDLEISVLDAAGFFGLDYPGKVIAEDNAIAEHFERLSQVRKVPRQHYKLVVIVGIGSFLSRLASDRADTIKESLRTLSPEDKTTVVLVDTASSAAGYMQQDWFKEQGSQKDALWIGEGLSNQSAIMLGYTSKPLDMKIRSDMGYLIDSGIPSLVKLVSARKKEGDIDGLLSLS